MPISRQIVNIFCEQNMHYKNFYIIDYIRRLRCWIQRLFYLTILKM